MTHYDSIELRSWVKKVRSNINQCSAALDYYETAIDTLNGVKEEDEKKKTKDKKKKKGD
jgi:prefoldin subunit 5